MPVWFVFVLLLLAVILGGALVVFLPELLG